VALRELLVEFTSIFNDKGVKEGHKATESLLTKVKEVGEALVAAFAVEKIYEFTEATVEAADAIGDQADRLRIGADALQRWRFAAEQNEIQGEELDGIFRKVATSALGVAQGSTEAVKNFKDLGVEAMGTNKQLKPTDALFKEIGLKLAAMPDQTKASALAFQYFGRNAGTKVLQLFKDGEEGLAGLNEEFDKLGGGIDGSFIKAADEADKSQKKLNTTWLITRTRIAAVLLPAIEVIVGKLTEFSTALGKLAKNTNLVKGALATMAVVGYATAVPLLIKYGALISKFALWAVLIALVGLAIEDLITWLEGGNAAFDDLIDSIFSADVAAEIRRWRDEFKDLKEPFAAIAEGWDSILTDMGASIDKFFLKWYGKWNSLVESMGLGDSFKIDTSKAEEELKYFNDRQAGLERKAYERENPNQVKADVKQDVQNAYGPRAVSKTRKYAGYFDGTAAPSPVGPPESPEATNRKIVRERRFTNEQDTERANLLAAREKDSAQKREAAAADRRARFLRGTPVKNADGSVSVGLGTGDRAQAPAVATAPVLPGTAAPVTNYYIQPDVKAPINITVPAGTPAQVSRDVQAAAKRGAEQGWRGAAAAFEQRGRSK
jgi:hypothetical protein